MSDSSCPLARMDEYSLDVHVAMFLSGTQESSDMQEGYRCDPTSMDGSVLCSLLPHSLSSTIITTRYDADLEDSSLRVIPIVEDEDRRWEWVGRRSELMKPHLPGHAKSSRPYQRRRR
jgi:hypothetical protein